MKTKFQSYYLRSNIVLLLLFCSLYTNAQILHGYVKTLGRPNKPGTPLNDVEIRVKGEHNTVFSNAKGEFSVLMLGKKNGEAYSLQRIYKKYYELCDKNTVGRSYAFSASARLTLTMASSRQIASDKRRIANNAYAVANKKYKSLMETLEKKKAENKIALETSQKQYQDLQQKYEKYQILIDGLSDHYARLDYDTMDEQERKISQLIEEGELDKADSLLKQNGIYKRIEQICNNLRTGQKLMEDANEEYSATLKQQEKDAEYLFQLYTIALARFDNEKARFYIETRAELDSTNAMWQYDAASYIAEYLSDYDAAFKYAKRGIRVYETRHSNDSLSMVRHLNVAGTILSYQEKYDEAVQYHNRARKIIQAYHAEYSEEAVDMHLCYGYIYSGMSSVTSINGQSDYAMAFRELAKEEYEKAIEVCKEMPNIGSNYKGGSYYGYATCLSHEAILDKSVNEISSYNKKNILAWNNYQKAIKMWEQDGIVNAGLIATCKMQMVSCISNNEEYKKQSNEAINLLTKIYGDMHPHIATCLMNLGYACFRDDNMKGALDYYEKAYNMRKILLGEMHTKTLISKKSINETKEIILTGLPGKYYPRNILQEYLKTKDLEKAETDFSLALNMLKAHEDSIWILQMEFFENLGLMYLDQKKYEDAIDAYSTAMIIMEQNNPDKNNNDFLRILHKLKDACLATKDFHTYLLFFYDVIQQGYIEMKEVPATFFMLSDEYIKDNPNDTEVMEKFQQVKDKIGITP